MALRISSKPCLALGAVLASSLMLAACDSGQNNSVSKTTGADSTPVALSKKDEVKDVEGDLEGTTPMAERVAVIGLLNKRNGIVRDLEMKPGEAIRVGRAVVRLRACEQAPAWEMPAETGAFVQLLTQERDGKWKQNFSGWLFRERPELNVVQHPIYDVIVKSCAMTTPGGGPAIKPADVEGNEGTAGIEGSERTESSAPKSAPAKSSTPRPAAKSESKSGATPKTDSRSNSDSEAGE